MKKYILFFLIIVNSPILAQLPGNALVFDGINDYVDCGDDASLNMTTEVTMEAWILTSSVTNARIISKWGSFSGYEIAFINEDIWFVINQTLRSSYTAASLVDQWAHLAVTYNGTNSAVYINGILESTGQNLQENLVNTGLILKIGQISNSSNSSFSGTIDEVRIWDRERTHTQIQSTMNNPLGPEYYSNQDSGLVGYWQFEEGVGDTAYDLSVHKNHGIIYGASWSISTGLSSEILTYDVPRTYMISQNQPNPFNPSTRISFTLPMPEHVTVEVYNTLGQTIEILINKEMNAGSHDIEFEGSNLPSGIYYYSIQAGEFNGVKKMVLLK